MREKPIIGITSAYVNHNYYMEGVYVHHDYHKAVIEAGGVPLILPIAPPDVLDRYVDLCDGFILSGGEDMDPQFYGENPHAKLGFFYTERDESELYLTHQLLKKEKPILAICRGLQVLNVALGGTLIQDIPSQVDGASQHVQLIQRPKTSHSIQLVDEQSKLYELLNEKMLMVNSLHHQAIAKLAEPLTITAKSSDGIIEAVEHKDRSFVLGVQWHPESMTQKEDTMKVLFQELVKQSMK